MASPRGKIDDAADENGLAVSESAIEDPSNQARAELNLMKGAVWYNDGNVVVIAADTRLKVRVYIPQTLSMCFVVQPF